MKETKTKVTPLNEEQPTTENKQPENIQSDKIEGSEDLTEKIQSDLELIEFSIEERESDVEERESAVEERENSVEERENEVAKRESAVNVREKAVEKRENSLKESKSDEMLPGLEFEFQGEKKKFKDSAPKLIRYEGEAMTQQQIINNEDALLDLVSSNSGYIQNL
ncbi:hypothetical protein [Chryseobacterium sp. MEBOG07]|uniref:hypothetical protein n=1 Tax=Chryseobacterium sp. MEBOG07 TaxID=2879939 RepID=UPI001F1A81D4|nr:hypothetical protein [Chryseobacterium sp. MEBOG07]UKB81250.1 hypothetical protein LF886_09745 [Chryseobacterium sp. MEBOG07]